MDQLEVEVDKNTSAEDKGIDEAEAEFFHQTLPMVELAAGRRMEEGAYNTADTHKHLAALVQGNLLVSLSSYMCAFVWRERQRPR